MKVRVEKNELADAVAWLSLVRGKRLALPALHGIRLEAVDGFLRLQATDMDTSGEVEIAAAIDEPGAVLPSATTLHAIVTRLPEAPITLSGNDDHVEITGGRVRGKVTCLHVDDFPHLPAVEDGPATTIPSTVMETVVRRVGPAADNHEKFPVLTGVYLRIGDGTLTAVATDSYQLHRFDGELETSGTADAIVPLSALGAVAKLGYPVHLRFGDGRVEFFAKRTRRNGT